MSINNFVFTNSDEKHILSAHIDKFGRKEVSFYYIDLITNKQYSCVCGFDDPAFRDVPKRFIPDALEFLIASKQYSIEMRGIECICIFEFLYFGRTAMITAELKEYRDDI